MAANEIKLFGKWGYEGVTVGDLSVEDFIALKPKDHVSLGMDLSRREIGIALPLCFRVCRFLFHTLRVATRLSVFARHSALL